MQRTCLALVALSMACTVQADTTEPMYSYQQVALVPADRSLVRPEDGVMLADGTLLIADQVHGLVALDAAGTKRPFGDFAAAGYVHEPPERSAGPNGVAMEPDGTHVLVADVLTGAIYRVNTETEQVVRIPRVPRQYFLESARCDFFSLQPVVFDVVDIGQHQNADDRRGYKCRQGHPAEYHGNSDNQRHLH